MSYVLASCLVYSWALLAHSVWERMFIDSGLSDTDSIVSFENITPINRNKKIKIKPNRAD